jgi:hypothetical protein
MKPKNRDKNTGEKEGEEKKGGAIKNQTEKGEKAIKKLKHKEGDKDE